jgi:gliding motility-associated-like protein
MRVSEFVTRLFVSMLILLPVSIPAPAQDCPPNIDFEKGNFDGWTCYIGNSSEVNGVNEIVLRPSGGPVGDRHTMFNAFPGGGVDPYGGFPVNCPNGSGRSIRLGNNRAGTEAEGVSYEFTIPPNKDVYSLIYHYAVVFQDPNHEIFQQPRLELEITNVSDNKLIECSSFTFIPYGTILPGFFASPNPEGDTPVWCKDWSAVSVNLNNLAGKTIRLFFKTADCTFRRHFGYAYIDVNSECSSEFVGASYCPDDTVVNVTAPYGYQSYTWFDKNFTRVLGRTQTISFTPLPQPGTVYAVQVVPYNGYGCLDTLYATMEDDLSVVSNAGVDALSCNRSPVQLGANSKPGLSYSWSPTAGLSNPRIANPLATPGITTAYVLTTRHDGGGCRADDTVIVKASVIDTTLTILGKEMYCSDSNDSSILRTDAAPNIQWYRDDVLMPGLTQRDYRIGRTGTYYAYLSNSDGCSIRSETKSIVIDDPRPGVTYPIEYAVIDLPLDLEARQFGDSAYWTPGTWLDKRETYTPIFEGSSDQLFTVEIWTKSGCLTVDTQMVKIVPGVAVHVPTAFTPNRDGLNDVLRPTLMGIKELKTFKVFNRWGQLVFQTTEERKGWDGTLGGQPVSSQVVVWMLEGIGVDNRRYLRKGTSVLIR